MEREDTLPLLGEVFREFGFEGASLSLIHKQTGIGRGSLYHFFPSGKEEMAAAVLSSIDAWFEREVFEPLAESAEPEVAIDRMFTSVDAYFRSGKRICLVGAFALSDTRDRFAVALSTYFRRWLDALAAALGRVGFAPDRACSLAEEVVTGIQGAIILTRTQQDSVFFERSIERLRAATRIEKA